MLTCLGVNSLATAQSSGIHPGRENGLSDKEILEIVDEMISACGQGDAQNCSFAGSEFIDGLDPVRQDIPRGVALNTKSCALGYTPACWRGSTLLLYGTQEYNAEQFVYFMEKLCELDDIDGCVSVAGFYYHGEGPEGVPFPKDDAKVTFYDARVCDLDTPPYSWAKFCTEAGGNYEDGVVVPMDLDKARKYYALGCERRDRTACEYLKYLQ